MTGGLLGVWAVASAGGFRTAAAGDVAAPPGAGPKFLTAAELSFVSAYADSLIPDTDTPGALSVGVPALFDHMMASWAGAKTRGDLRRLLADLQRDLAQAAGHPFDKASRDARLQALTVVDAQRYAAEPGTIPGPYRQFKILIARLYYSTRIGATVELRYEPIPGDWKSDIPFSDVGRSWAK
jgi:gluconate 2-dehydrogenase gamma chain